jgi:hypothetical protein
MAQNQVGRERIESRIGLDSKHPSLYNHPAVPGHLDDGSRKFQRFVVSDAVNRETTLPCFSLEVT